MINVLVNGANGKMGQEAVKAIEQDPELELVATTGRQDNLANAILESKAQVVVELTNADAVYENLKIIIAAGVHPVIGSSGLTQSQIEECQTLCAKQKLGGIIAPNFSIGAILMMRYAQDAAQYFSDAEIIEMHHKQKLDAPSGTAKKTAQMIGRDVPIHSVRLDGVVAHQSVIFGGHGGTLTITHNTINREEFMPGVLMACKHAPTLKELIYGLENIL